MELVKLIAPRLKREWLFPNEPGYYEQGKYGIRIESLIYVKKSQDKGFLDFETLTLAPIALNLIDIDMLNASEKAWLNAYHKRVYEQLSKQMSKSEKAWLKEQTKKI